MHQTINKINDHNSSCPTQSKLVANGVHRLAIESFHSSIVGTVMGDKVPKVPEPGRQVPEPGRQVPEPCASSELGAHARYQPPATRD